MKIAIRTNVMSATRDTPQSSFHGNVDLLVAVTSEGAVAAKHATATIPIVFVVVPDPVGIKLVAELASSWRQHNRAIDLND